ncbi:hypothetical protein [Alteromonas sp. 14N.309.X.WAT.G.H12]|uniref:hypothetical protein n=1 Tax=Alteromonas sp. 14N.309.X.WAT.G.H12 TaxID=3120824 RepID=UPI002FD089FB
MRKSTAYFLLTGLIIAFNTNAVMLPSADELDKAINDCETLLIENTNLTSEKLNPSSKYHPSLTLGNELNTDGDLPLTIRYNRITDIYCHGHLDNMGRVFIDATPYQKAQPYNSISTEH